MLFLLAYFAGSRNTPGNGAPIILMLLAAGIVVFILGFRKYRKFRLMEDIPITPIRAAAMGLVHVLGRTTGPKLLTSPLSKVPCFSYLVTIQEEVEKAGDDQGKEWKTIAWDHAEERFYLEDASGKILVEPHGATFDMPDTFSARINQGSWVLNKTLKPGHIERNIDPALGIPGPSEEEVIAYLNSKFEVPARRQEQFQTALKEHPVMMGMLGFREGGRPTVTLENLRSNYKIMERCLVAGRTYLIMGTCKENPAPAEESDRKLITRGVNEKTFLITNKTEKQLEKSLLHQAILMVLIGAAIIVGDVAFLLYLAGAF